MKITRETYERLTEEVLVLRRAVRNPDDDAAREAQQ